MPEATLSSGCTGQATWVEVSQRGVMQAPQGEGLLEAWEKTACVLRRSVVSNSAAAWTVSHQAPLSMGFLRQEY